MHRRRHGHRDDRGGDRLRIRRAVVGDLLAHAKAEAPRECCGLLLGAGGLIDENVRTRNLSPSPARYRVDPEAHFAAIRRTRAAGRAILGAYHSHPAGPAEPSPTDLTEAAYPEFVYVIVGLAAGEDVRGWRIRDGRAEPAGLTVVD